MPKSIPGSNTSWSRRDWLTTSGLGGLGALVAPSCGEPDLGDDAGVDGSRIQPDGGTDGAVGGRLRNVLLISIDDLNDWVGFLHGHPQTLTPNLDALAASGLVFSNAHCSAPACNPSRAATLLGLHPTRSGIYGNDQPWRLHYRNAATMPQAFSRAGFHSMRAGKVFHRADPSSWDEHFPDDCVIRPPEPSVEGRPLNGFGVANFDWGPLDVAEHNMGDYQVASAIEALLGRSHSKPFFVGCGLYRPHLEFYAPRPYFEPFPLADITLPPHLTGREDLVDLPPAGVAFANEDFDHKNVIDNNQWRSAVRAYLACIHFADAMLGRVIRALDASPHRDSTAVVLWSDHGWHLGEKLHWRKFSLWEEATRVPMIMRIPGLTTPGTTCTRPVSLQDIYPTLSQLFQVETGHRLDGRDLTPLLENPEAAWDHPALTTWLPGNHSLRDERFRYVRYAEGGEELYDHEADPHEWRNLAQDAGYQSVKDRLASMLPTLEVPPVPTADMYSAEQRACQPSG